MRSFLLFLILCPLSQSSWTCPDDPNELDKYKYFPYNNSDDIFPSNTNCTWKVSVSSGYIVEILYIFDIDNFNATLRVYDSFGIDYTPLVLEFPTISAATDIFIELVTYTNTNNGEFSFHYSFDPVDTNNATTYSLTQNNPITLLALLAGPVVVKASEPIVVYGGYTEDKLSNLDGIEEVFVFAGEGANISYLGTLYSLQGGSSSIKVDKPPYSVTIYTASSFIYGGFLIRCLSDIQNISYGIQWMMSIGFMQNRTITLDATKGPSAITLIESIYYHSRSVTPGDYLCNVVFSQNDGQLAWYPGEYLPPHNPIVVYTKNNNSLSRIWQQIPGPAKTFLAQSGVVNFTLTSYDQPDTQTYKLGDVGYFASNAYPSQLYQGSQATFSLSDVYQINFNVIDSYSSFKLTIFGEEEVSYQIINNGTTKAYCRSFDINYPWPISEVPEDTGGLIRFEIVKPEPWECINYDLGKGKNGQYPAASYPINQFASNLNCLFKITVPNGLAVTVTYNFNKYNFNASLDIFDATGQKYDLQNLSLNTTSSAVDLYINFTSYLNNRNGNFTFSWVYTDLTNLDIKHFFVKPKDQAVILPIASTFGTTSVVSSNSSLIVMVPSNQNLTADVIEAAQLSFIFMGNETNLKYMASYYSLLTNSKLFLSPISLQQVTIISVLPLRGGYLIRPQSDLLNVDYKFLWQTKMTLLNNIFAISASSNRKAAVTLFMDTKYTEISIIAAYFSNASTQLQWLAGTNLPPSASIATYSNENNTLNKIPQIIPSQIKTFAVSNGEVLLTFTSRVQGLTTRQLTIGDTVYFSSYNYPYPSAMQSIQQKFVVEVHASIKFELLACYHGSYFTFSDGRYEEYNITTNNNYNWDNLSQFEVYGPFWLTYVYSGNGNDTGGLGRFTVEYPRASSMHSRIILAFSILFVTLIFE